MRFLTAMLFCGIALPAGAFQSCSSAIGWKRIGHNGRLDSAFQRVIRPAKFSISASASTSPAPMEYVKLGKSDLLVSKCCLGTMTWGQQNTEDEGVEQLNVAFDEFGINFLDTAEMYPVPTKAETQGRTDKTIGRWLKSRDRSKVIVASKVAGYSKDITWLPGRGGKGPRVSYRQIMDSVESSLQRLGTDYIDLLQIHWPDRYVPLFGAAAYNYTMEREGDVTFEEQLRAFDDLIRQGKVRYMGVSNETPYGVMKFAQLSEKLNLPKVVSIQNAYSLINRIDFETSLTEVCSPKNENIGLLAYSPLAGGVLSGKYIISESDPAARNWRLNLFPGYMARYRQSLAAEAVGKYVEVASKYGLSTAELSLLFVKSRQFVASTIVGATSVEQLRENVRCFGAGRTLPPEAVADIEAVYKRYKDPSRI